MKFVKFLILLSIVFVSSCSNENSLYKSSDFKYTNEMNLENMTISYYQYVAPSEKGIYYTIGNYLYFYDFSSNKHILLCNKPNCRHNLETDQFIGQECNAYLKNASYGGILFNAPIVYNNKKIYMVQQSINFQTGFQNGYDIVEIEQDGSNRKVLLHDDKYINNLFVHRESLFYIIDNNIIYKCDLNDNVLNKIELLPNQLATIYTSFCYEQYLYLSMGTYIDSNGIEYYGVYGRLNLESNQFEIIKENEENLYFTLLDKNIIAYTKDFDTYLYHIDSKEESILSDNSGMIHTTDDYIFVVNGPNEYIEGTNSIDAFDKEYNLIDSIELQEGMKYCTAGAYNNQLFVLYEDPNENSNISRLYNLFVKNNKLAISIFCEIDTSQTAKGYQWNVNDYK